jgi:hypothetical protein
VFTGMRGSSVLYYLSRQGFQWDGEHCRNAERHIVIACRMLPYSDSGVPFLMGTPVTTPVTIASAVSDFRSLLDLERRPGSSVWILYSRQREPTNRAVDREIERSLPMKRYVPVRNVPEELARYRIRQFRSRV